MVEDMKECADCMKGKHCHKHEVKKKEVVKKKSVIKTGKTVDLENKNVTHSALNNTT